MYSPCPLPMSVPAEPPSPQGGAQSRPPASVRLSPLTETRLKEYLESLIVEYARDHVRDGQWSEGESLERARKEVATLLPQGTATPGHYLRAIVSLPREEEVGRIWYARTTRGEGGPPHLFIYDLLVLESQRGHGYGEAALRALEPVARGLGVDRIALHVFGHNSGAIRLYERVGYRPTNILMSKAVGSSGTTAPP